MKLYYNPLDLRCKSIIGAIGRTSEITFRIYQSESGEDNFSADVCALMLYKDGQAPSYFPMRKESYGWSLTLKFNQIGLFFYHFRIGDRYLSCGTLRKGELGMSPQSWQITVHDENFATPEWFKGGIMYQIFPDRFHKAGNYPLKDGKILRSDWGGTPSFAPNAQGKVLNNDFFGGNLNGVTEKLDYLKDLGVTTVYFNPIFEAYSNHRYDTGDYMKIDGLLGSEQDFDRLITEGKKRGIRVILDGVFNHTGDDSRYFNRYGHYDDIGAYQSQQSPYYEWYRFQTYPEKYESWWGIDTLPAVNENSTSYQNFIFGQDGVIKHWLKRGIGGYRLDVADELPDFFLKKLRNAVKEENEDALIIGEVWEDASNKIAYSERRQYLQGYELDSVMNYPLKDAIISYAITGITTQLRETIDMLIDNYPKTVLDSLMNILGTHDTVRILTVLGQKTCYMQQETAQTKLSEQEKIAAKQKLKVAAVLQYTLPGVPCVYYGDENAMEGYRDPFCRGCFDWDNQDKELNAFYKKLGKIRGKELNAVFKDGEYHEVFADINCLVFCRKTKTNCAYVFINQSSNQYTVTLNGSYKEHFSGKTIVDKLKITAYSYGILTKQK